MGGNRLLEGLKRMVAGADRGELTEVDLEARLLELLDPEGGSGRKPQREEEINRTLFRISNAVNTTHDLDELYASIHGALSQVIDVTNFYIAIHHPERGTLSFPYHVDETDDSFEEVPVDFEEINSLTAQVFLDRKTVLFKEAELRRRDADGRVQGPVPLVWLGVPLMVKNKVIGVMAVQSYSNPNRFDGKDVDVLNSVSDQVAVAVERKQAEESLGLSERRFREMADLLPTIVCEVDRDLSVTYMNRRGLETFRLEGAAKGPLFPFLDLVHPAERDGAEGFLRSLDGEEGVGTAEFRFAGGAAGDMAALVHASTILRKGALEGVRISITDLTIRKRLESELQKAHKMETVGTLAGGIAHDFNNILAAIMGSLSLARDAEGAGVNLRDYLSRAEEATLIARDLIQRFITFSRGWQPNKKRTSLRELLENALQFALEGTPVTYRLSAPEALWAVEIDPAQMSRVFSNLILNAREAMPGGGEVEVRAENTTWAGSDRENGLPLSEGPYVRVVLRDSGPGIAPEHLPFVFDPYFSTKERGSQKGMGLGLTVAYSIVQKHHGHLGVDSEPEEGATFSLYLPAAPQE